MILYYDKTGVLKEIINDGSLRQGDYDIDTIYVYVEELDYVSAAVSYLLPDGETFVGPQSFANRTELQIPFDAKRDLKYFKYYKDYEFLAIPLEADQDGDNLGNGPLDQTGTVHCQISIILSGGSVKQLGEFNFHVEESPVTNLKYVSTQEWLSLSDYQYLVGQLGAALKAQPNTTTVYSQSATGFTVRSASPVASGYYPAVSVGVYTVNEPVFVIGGWLGNVIQYGLRIYGDKISYKAVDGSSWTDISYSNIETGTHAAATYLAKSAGGVTYTQSANKFSVTGFGIITFDMNVPKIVIQEATGSTVQITAESVVAHKWTGVDTELEWDDIETKTSGVQTYLAKSASSWGYTQGTDGLNIGRSYADPNLGGVYEYFDLKMYSTNDTDATGVGLTKLPTLSLSTNMIDNPNYSDDYDISADINALGIKTTQGVEGQYTQKYIKFKDIAQQIEIGPFTSVSDLAAALLDEGSYDYTSNDIRIYAVKRTTSSVTHSTMAGRRQCVYRIYTTKIPPRPKTISLYIKVYDDDFALVDYDNATHGDLYAVITM